MTIQLPDPPESALRLATDDVGELEAFVARTDRPHSRVVHGRGPLGYRGAVLGRRGGGLTWVTFAQRMTLFGSVGDPTVHLVRAGGARYRVGRRAFDAGRGDIVLVPPDVEMSIDRQPGSYVSVQLPGSAFQTELAARRPGLRGGAALRIRRLRCGDREGDALAGAVRAYRNVLAEGHERPVATADLALAAWIVDAALVGGAVASVAPLRAERARRLEEWIEAHLGEPITLGRLCDVAGVGERCLQKTFALRRGTSPLDYVRQRRLLAIRARLQRAGAGAQVTDVAMDFGIAHFGRFSVQYRQAFGESPSTTLSRRPAAV